MKGIGLCWLAVIFGFVTDVPAARMTNNDVLEGTDTWPGVNGPSASAFCAGWVTSDAQVLKAMPPKCFNPSQANSGVYFVEFNPPLRGIPLCFANQIYPGSFDSHGNTRDNVVIMNADVSRMAYVSGNQYGVATNRNVTFLCIA
jgi:hypothetical protein